MKYRTMIEVISEAENEHDALDIAGEFLRGNLESGVRIKSRTKPLKSHILLQVTALSAILLVFAFTGIEIFGHSKSMSRVFFGTKNTNAVQPPLKTGKGADFKETWKEEEHRKVLDYIKGE